MQSSDDHLIPILFKVLFGFVGLNVLINFVLLYIRRQRINKLLALYWPIVLLGFILQGNFQTGHLNVTLAYTPILISAFLAAIIGCEAVNRKLPYVFFASCCLVAFALTFWFAHQGYSFTTIAMPLSIASAIPVSIAFYFLNIKDYKKTTKLQKVLGVVFFCQAIHCINFAVFRMDPGAQLWGWLVTYVLCDLLAIIFPSITLELASLTENERLRNLVDERTDELNKSLKTNQSLFKVLLHDISNPMMVMKGYIHMLSGDRGNKEMLIGKTQKAQMTMEDIVNQMKKFYINKGISKEALGPVSLHDCFKEISFIFEEPLMHKSITLVINNQLAPHSCVQADHISLTHSVLSNLVSNGIKFNPINSKVEIIAREDSTYIIIEVCDQGPGMPEKTIQDIMMNKELLSTDGTNGEKGSGLGLSIAKSFVDSYGGKMEFQNLDPGTCVRLSLNKA